MRARKVWVVPWCAENYLEYQGIKSIGNAKFLLSIPSVTGKNMNGSHTGRSSLASSQTKVHLFGMWKWIKVGEHRHGENMHTWWSGGLVGCLIGKTLPMSSSEYEDIHISNIQALSQKLLHLCILVLHLLKCQLQLDRFVQFFLFLMKMHIRYEQVQSNCIYKCNWSVYDIWWVAVWSRTRRQRYGDTCFERDEYLYLILERVKLGMAFFFFLHRH